MNSNGIAAKGPDIDSITIRRRTVITRSQSDSSLSNQDLSSLPSPGSNGNIPNFNFDSTGSQTSGLTLVRHQVSRTRLSDMDAEDDDEDEEVEEIVEEYITLHRGMATMSDVVTSFYLRLGVLCEIF